MGKGLGIQGVGGVPAASEAQATAPTSPETILNLNSKIRTPASGFAN